MELLGERQLAASRQVVWEALNDPAMLKDCLRGCDRLSKVSDSTFEATIAAKVGPIRATFLGSVALSDIDAPSSYTIAFEGKGGAAGFAKGKARVQLADAGGGTLLRYVVDASLGGKLGQMGSRVVDGVAREMADDFFGRFADAVGRTAAAEAAAAPVPATAEGAGSSARRWTIVAALGAALAVATWLLLR